jgi:hypothetical protein
MEGWMGNEINEMMEEMNYLISKWTDIYYAKFKQNCITLLKVTSDSWLRNTWFLSV